MAVLLLSGDLAVAAARAVHIGPGGVSSPSSLTIHRGDRARFDAWRHPRTLVEPSSLG